MKCLSVLALVAAPLAASAAIISSSSGYNDPTQSLDTVACYDYFSAQGAKILGDLVPYPLLTVSTLVEGSDSLYCGTCWSFTHGDKNVSAIMIDGVVTLGYPTDDIFITSTAVMDQLTGGTLAPGEYFEGVAVQVDISYCVSLTACKDC